MLDPCRVLYRTPLAREEARCDGRCHTPPPPCRRPYQIGSSRPYVTSANVTSADVTSAVRVALRRRTDMVMQASMWVLGVMSRCRCRLIVHRVHWPRRSGWWSERGVAGYRKDRWARGNLRGGRPIPSLPASTRREAGSTHTLPLFLAHDLEGVQHHIPTGQKSGTRRARSAAAINADAPAGSYDSTVHTIVDLLR